MIMTLTDIDYLKEKVIGGSALTKEEAYSLANTEDKEELYAAANDIREHFKGNKFDLCSITNARSGKCPQDCKWCTQSSHYKTDVDIYDMIDSETAVEQAKANANAGVHRYSLVTSGRAISDKHLDRLLVVYDKIKEVTNISLCASMGLLTKQQLNRLKESGVTTYHCNIETAPSYFPQLVTTHTVEEKIETIKYAQSIGLKVCSGGILGMGETPKQRVEMALTLHELGIMSIPLNILMAMEGTPLQNAKPMTDDEVLTAFAMFRFINPKANIRFAGGRLLIKHLEERALKAGINSALVGDLLTTIGSNVAEDKETFTKLGFDIS